MKTILASILCIMLSACGSVQFCKGLPTVHNQDNTHFNINKPVRCE